MRRVGTTLCIGLVLLSACGGGGGGGGGGGNGGPNGPPSGQATYYVRASGSDTNNGSSPDRALRSIGAAAEKAGEGARIVVGPGVYPERIIDPKGMGTATAPITYFADSKGSLTGDDSGPVIVDATGVSDPNTTGVAFRFTATQFIVVDGFVITGVAGGSSSAIFIRNRTVRGVAVPSHDITIRNCHIDLNDGDAIRISNSDDILIFNNLLTNNGRRGVVAVGDQTGSQRLQLINNTIFGNADRGVFIGESGASSANAFLRNNIIQDNGGDERRANLQVDEGSLDGFDSAFNLVFPARYNPADLPHDSDIEADASFVDAGDNDYHLDQSSSPAIDAGDSDFPDPLLDTLRAGSTDPDGRPDTGDIDLGFHFPTDQAIPPPGPPRTFFVREEAGNDDNDGLSPELAVSSIGLALVRARENDTVIVGPGLYTEGSLTPRDNVAVLADPTGEATGDDPGEVRVDARGRDAGFLVDRSTGTVIDGFVVARASRAGIEVRNGSDNVIIRHCVVLDGFQDGIQVADSNDVLLFNNLVIANTRYGVSIGGGVSGSTGTRVVNNTIARNESRGIRIGETSVASSDTLVQNNIIQGNSPNIQVVEGSDGGYDDRYNVVFEATYSPATLTRANDINEDALFIDARNDDFHLDQLDSPAIDAADPDTDPPLVTRLRQRTTASDGSRDNDGDLDIGFHYP